MLEGSPGGFTLPLDPIAMYLISMDSAVTVHSADQPGTGLSSPINGAAAPTSSSFCRHHRLWCITAWAVDCRRRRCSGLFCPNFIPCRRPFRSLPLHARYARTDVKDEMGYFL